MGLPYCVLLCLILIFPYLICIFIVLAILITLYICFYDEFVMSKMNSCNTVFVNMVCLLMLYILVFRSFFL